MNVLVCEDDQDILDLIEIILTNEGHSVFKSTNNKTFTESLENGLIDLIIVDYWLKAEKADSIIDKVRSQEEYKNIPIVLVSAIANIQEVAGKLKLNEVLKKPFNISDLQNIVNKYNTYDKKNSDS